MGWRGWPWAGRIGGCLALSFLLLAGCAGSGKQANKRQAIGNQHYRLGLLHYQRAKYIEAIAELKKSIQSNPDFDMAINLLGLVYLDTGEYAEARKYFLKALEKNPYFTDAHNNLGTVYRKMGVPEKALEEFRIALEDGTYQTPEKVHYNIAMTLFEMHRPEEGIVSLETAIEIAPRYGKARLDLASALKDMGRHSEARKQLELIVQLIPDSQEAIRARDLLDANEY